MDLQKEKQLLDLARKLDALDREITKQRKEKGKEDLDLRKRFYDTEDEIREIFAESAPLDEIRDTKARGTLRKVKSGDSFQLDKESKHLEELFSEYPKIVSGIIEEKGITVTDDEVEEDRHRTFDDFHTEMVAKIDPYEYFERKKKFGTIIADRRLHSGIQKYFENIRECFLYGQHYAVIGLCRVLIELAFRDIFAKLGLGKREQYSNVHDFDRYGIHEVFRLVCAKLNTKHMQTKAERLYKISSDILHGRDINMQLEESQILDFVRKTFEIVESIYQ
jgi:hypothetical protein